jgi:phage terminase large subunit-like protein
MVSAVGRTPAHFADLRRSLGERMWWAEFQGVPASPEGNVIRRAWLDSWRLSVMPGSLTRTVVAVDPSDSGEGDSAGIVAASLTAEDLVVVHRDISEPMTPDAWARAAIELAIDTGASEIAVETFNAREGYMSLLNTTLGRYRSPHPVRVSSWPPKNNRSGRGRGDAMARSAKLIQGLEIGTVRLVGHLPNFEAQATRWQAGQHQPDCIAAAVIAHDVLTHGGPVHIVSFADTIRRAREGLVPPPPEWMRCKIGGGR